VAETSFHTYEFLKVTVNIHRQLVNHQMY